MPKQLPFAVSPKPYEIVKVGTEEAGVLEIKKLGSLSRNEAAYIKELSKELPDLKRDAVKLAQQIAKEQGFSAVDVHQALIQGNVELLSDYLGEVLEFQDKINTVAEQREQLLATAILKFRVDADWEPQHTGDAELIHPDLVREIALFASREESGWAEEAPPETDAEPMTEEDLGNS